MKEIKIIDLKDFRDQEALKVLQDVIKPDTVKAKSCGDAQWITLSYRDTDKRCDVEIDYYIDKSYSEIEAEYNFYGKPFSTVKEGLEIKKEVVEDFLHWSIFDAEIEAQEYFIGAV